ncbi:hypothetical protein GGQ92_001748 [Gracilibacillus halotolerans]|uniref:ABC-2 family transporter protein n=1 Tax=Gracilibacillus halotolerans TaxID=74386 RepID=A0A841RKC8_9BACI|nr:hypothetical protein [Gracilibacillus halotolerans]MBB6512959.1 hypothetical protein [Gracilibacillus halotolerans]
MKLFWMELKKIFTWPVILLVVILNLLLYILLIEFELEYFPNGRPAKDVFQVEMEMIDRYGEVIDEDEFADFIGTYDERVKDANEFLQTDELAIKAGVDSYEEFRNTDIDDMAAEEMHSHIMFELEEDLFWELQARESIIERYESRVTGLEFLIRYQSNSKQEKERIREMLQNRKFQYYSELVLRNFENYSSQVVVIILLSIAIVLSPIYIRDKVRDIVPLQYTSKKGRGIFHLKWRAGLTSIGILLAIHLLIYGGLYLTNDTAHYFFMHVYSMSNNPVWYDITFGEFILLTIVAIIMLGYVFGILTIACSALVGNYLTQISTQILLFCAFAFVMIPVGVQRIIETMYLPWVVPTIYISLILFVCLTDRFVKKRELVKDI